jgi:hypothetical protein
MFCTQCGTKLAEASRFCSNCGATQATASHELPPAQPVLPTQGITAPAHTALQVTGYLIGAVSIYNLFILIRNLININDWLWAFGGSGMEGTWRFYYTSNIFLSAFLLFAAAMAITHSNNVYKGAFLQLLGAISVVGVLLLNVIYLSMGVFEFLGTMSFVLALVGLILPIFYTVEATQNKNACAV